MRRDSLYIAFCLIFPALWGIVSAYLFDRSQAWMAKRHPVSVPTSDAPLSPPVTEEISPDMYHI